MAWAPGRSGCGAETEAITVALKKLDMCAAVSAITYRQARPRGGEARRRSPPVVWTCRARRCAGFPPAQSLSFPSGGGERRGDGLRVPSSEGPLRLSPCMRLASASGFCQLRCPHAGQARRQRRSLPRVISLLLFALTGSLPSCGPHRPPAARTDAGVHRMGVLWRGTLCIADLRQG